MLRGMDKFEACNQTLKNVYNEATSNQHPEKGLCVQMKPATIHLPSLNQVWTNTQKLTICYLSIFLIFLIYFTVI